MPIARIPRQFQRVALLTAAFALVATACSSSTATPTAPPASVAPTAVASPTAATIAKATVSTTGLVQSLDYINAAWTSTPNKLAGYLGVGGYLYTYSKDGTKIIPELAKSEPVPSADGKTLTITLREGLKYSDGTPVSPADAVTALERTKTGPHKARISFFDKVEVNASGQLVYYLNAPFDFATQGIVFGDWMPLHPSAKVNDASYWAKPVSTGPYVVSEYTAGGPIVTLKANPYYWAGKPVIDTLVLSAAVDSTSRILQVTTGAVEMAVDIPFTLVNLLPKEVKTTITPIGGVYWVAFNWAAPSAVSDVNVRKAICLAIDRNAVVQRAFAGLTEPAASFLSKYTPGWKGASEVPNKGARDLATAKTLLASSKYPSGGTFKLQTWTNRAGWSDAAAVIAENLKEIGLTATIEGVTDTVGIANIRSSSFEVMFSGGAGDVLTHLSTGFEANGLWMLGTHFNDPEVTALAATARQNLGDPVKFQSTVESLLSKQWSNSLTYCPIAERAIVVATRLSPDVMTVIPAGQYVWVAVIPR